MAGTFELKSASNGKFMFNLLAGNGQVILTSQMYEQREAAHKGIESVRTNAPMDERFERKTSEGDQPYFVLNAANHQQIGKSQMYSSTAAMETGIESVKTHAPGAQVKDTAD